MEKANLQDLRSFITADGASIRELAGPAWTPARRQSLAEATVAPGEQTAEHFHPQTEELYYFVAGEGRMRLGEEEAAVARGDCVVIPPGTRHQLFNDGTPPLVLTTDFVGGARCCAPAYSDDDTVMTGR